jgi:hypothetical protein
MLGPVIVYNWREEASRIFVTIKRPVAEIFVKATNSKWRALTLYVDSGADVTILRRSYGELLGLDVEKGRPARFKGFGKGEIKTYLHDLELKIGNDVIKTKVAISDDDTVPNVLGRKDVFDRCVISFLNGKAQTSFSLVASRQGPGTST